VDGTTVDLTQLEYRVAGAHRRRFETSRSADLFTSCATVDYHLHDVFRMFNVGTRAQLSTQLQE
jgi:DNA-binding CsgD family transcriptional regulator